MGKIIPSWNKLICCSIDILLQEISLDKQRNLGLKWKGVNKHHYLNTASQSSKLSQNVPVLSHLLVTRRYQSSQVLFKRPSLPALTVLIFKYVTKHF